MIQIYFLFVQSICGICSTAAIQCQYHGMEKHARSNIHQGMDFSGVSVHVLYFMFCFWFGFLIHMNIICNKFCSSGHMSVSFGINIGHCMQTFQPYLFMPCLKALLTSIHSIPLCMTLTMAGGHKVSAKQNLLASSSCTFFCWSEWKFDMVLKQFKLNVLILNLSEILWNKENNCQFTDSVKTLTLTCIQTVIDQIGSHLVSC